MTKSPEKESASQAAFEHLKQRVEADSALSVEVREAVLADLASDKPSAFQALRALFIAKDRSDGTPDEVESPERSRPSS